MESETTLQNRPTEGPPCLTIENGTLCSFCHESLNHPPADPGNHVRKLDDLLGAAEFCGYCALWVRSLEASAHALVEDGQDAAMKSHPLLQGVFDPSEVELQYVDLHDWIGGGIEQRIAWPRVGTIWATLDLVPASDSSLINMEPLSSSDKSETVWEGIKWWLSECTSEHDECRSHRDKSWKPTRLLHLGTPSQPMEIQLVDGKSTPDTAEYLTLSHCWGTVTPLRLTTDTIETFQSSIPVHNLPKTFLDACKTTRRLGYEYLWIDSLCIVQNDSADWAFEAGRMSLVYGNSFLTLAATAANDANQGLFCPPDQRDPASWLPVRIRRDWGAQFAGDFYACDYRDWWTKLDNSPLNRRGWAFQERMLAPRVLHLGLEQVAFECPATSACERLPFGNLGRVDGQMGGPGSKVKRFMAEAGENERKLGVDDILRRWNEMVRNYSHGRFGVETDKMVALTGVVDSFASLFYRHLKQISEEPQEGVTPDNGDALKQKANNVEESDKPKQETLFVGGLWRPQMEMQLAWRATSKVQSQQLSGIAPPGFGRRPQTYVAPTWSWCSLNDTLVEPQQANPVDLLLTKVLEAKIDPATEHPICEKNSGLRYCCGPSSFLRLQCSQLPLAGFGRIHGLAFFDFDFETRQAPTQIESTNYWDIEYEDEALKADMPCIVPVFVDMTRVMRPVHGIILDQRSVQDSDEKYYVRLGAFVLKEADAIKAMWDALGKFDRFNPVGRLCDGMHRPAEDGYNYTKKDEVLQRVVCIQ